MSSASILRPDILVIGNRSYRINPSSLPGLESTNQQQDEIYREEEESDYYPQIDPNEDEPSCKAKFPRTTTDDFVESTKSIPPKDEPIEEDDDTIEFNPKEKMFVFEMDVASAFYGALIGKGSETKTKIEQETKTQIFFPRRDEIGMVKIRGATKTNVQSARTRMELIIDRNRQLQPITHFLSLPIGQSVESLSIREKYEEFQKKVLEQCADERAVNKDLFQQGIKLHLTITTFVLLSKSEIDFIRETLNECVDEFLRQYLPTDGKCFRIQLKGLEFMNDDPAFVDVLYAKVQLVDKISPNRLQNFLDRLNQELTKTGLTKQKFERLKLHVTLMNSLLRRDDTGILEAQKTARGRVKNADRESFDATKILRLFGQFDFGQVDLDELQLNIMHEPDRKSGYYGCALKIPLKRKV